MKIATNFKSLSRENSEHLGEYLAAAITGANLDGDDDGDDSESKTWATLLAIGAVVLLTAFNTLNIRSSANFQNALSVVKVCCYTLLMARESTSVSIHSITRL